MSKHWTHTTKGKKKLEEIKKKRAELKQIISGANRIAIANANLNHPIDADYREVGEREESVIEKQVRYLTNERDSLKNQNHSLLAINSTLNKLILDIVDKISENRAL